MAQKGRPTETMSDQSATSYCFECRRPLAKIDNYGKRLTGCMTCLVAPGAKVRLSEEDLRALHQLRRKK
jgi:hypothetical protein